MENKKYNPFVVKPKPKPLPKPNAKTQPTNKLEAQGLSPENRKKLDIIFSKGFVKTTRKYFDYDNDSNLDYNNNYIKDYKYNINYNNNYNYNDAYN